RAARARSAGRPAPGCSGGRPRARGSGTGAGSGRAFPPEEMPWILESRENPPTRATRGHARLRRVLASSSSDVVGNAQQAQSRRTAMQAADERGGQLGELFHALLGERDRALGELEHRALLFQGE